MKQWDEWQREAFDAVGSGADALTIIGGPGTGKTAVLEELVRTAASGGRSVALLTADRRAAAESLVRVSRSLGCLSESVEVRSIAAFCYAIVEEFAEQTGRERPELVSGPEEDAILREILESEHIEFPLSIPQEVQAMPAFRAELRRLLTRAAELGLSPDALAELGRASGNDLWIAGARVRRAYEARLAGYGRESGGQRPLLAADRLDHSMLVTKAQELLGRWEDAAGESVRSAKPVARPAWDMVLVDDVQNAPRSILGLLRRLKANGSTIVAAGDPDCSVQGFRGAVASLPADLARPEPEGICARLMRLGQSHRGGRGLSRVGERLASTIRVAGSAASRGALPGPGADGVFGRRWVNETEEAAGIARAIREWHLFDAVDYGDIAVVTRSRAAHGPIRRELVRRGVPVMAIGSDLPLHMHRAVGALVDLLRLALEPPQEDEDAGKAVRAVLEGPLWAVDPLTLRRLGMRLRGIELAAGRTRGESELFAVGAQGEGAVAALSENGLAELRHLAHVIDAVREAAAEHARGAEQVLWAAWDACAVASRWREKAMSGREDADEANDNLDAVLQLFRFAQRMADRDPDTDIDTMMAQLESQELPQDSIARHGALGDSVVLATPASLQGREFARVVIARLNEGTWPNLTVRDPLMRTGELSARVAGRFVEGLDAARRYQAELEEVLDDELRQLRHAAGRARDVLLVTCVDGEDLAPSRFLGAMGFDFAGDGHGEGGEHEGRAAPVAVVEEPAPLAPDMDVSGLAGALRRYALVEGPVGARARRILERLENSEAPLLPARMRMDGAAPTGGAEPADAKPRVSPSAVEGLLECPLHAIISGMGYVDASTHGAAQAGTMIHKVLERHPLKPEGMGLASFVEALQGEFLEMWHAEFGEEASGWEARDLERHLGALEKAAGVIAGARGEVMTERRFEIEGSGAIVACTIDRIEIDGAESVIYDYKTGTAAVTKQQAQDNVQLQLYQWAVFRDESLPNPAGAHLLYLGLPTKSVSRRSQTALDEAGLARAEERIGASASLLSRERVPARPGPRCSRCAFQSLCPQQPKGRIFS